MILIELHGLYGPIAVNPNYIASICEGEYGSDVFMANDSTPVQVKESLKEILNLIQSALQ